ncbi:hypothetical protein MVEN_02650400 [Mycena venus]|uniref:BHLH domain-containing protein n=1 Tax=Mycena venus TaxID=2733690 RepID=A0A8H6WMP7_9AGAR|nr:hypothetical protein MVEN_02650400 [Mycena venus]
MRPYTPNDGAGISPPSLRTGEMSWNGLTSGRRSRGSSSHSPPATFSAGSAAAASAPHGRADSRCETIRKLRIESEQRRRDELGGGYARLKDTLLATNQESNKVSLLDRATNHIRNLKIGTSAILTKS